MKYTTCLTLCLVALLLAMVGCARAARDTTGYSMTDSMTLNASFEDTWQAVKHVLIEQNLNIYTRDKRGTFVAYSDAYRELYIFTPHRTQLTIQIENVSSETSKVSIETLDQVYGVTLLTYPNWHDRKTKDNEVALGILDALKAKLEQTPTDQTPTEQIQTEEAPAA